MGNLSVPEPSYKGKVRDVYDLDDKLILVTSDRLSAFDVIFPDSIPGKGKILTTISTLWFRNLSGIHHHLIASDLAEFPEPYCNMTDWDGRAVLVHKTSRINYEFVVRSHLMGSALAEYSRMGTVNGKPMPPGMVAGSRLPVPVLTPTTKADTGHDQPVTIDAIIAEFGQESALHLESLALRIFQLASAFLRERGIVLLDTKMEFGFDSENSVTVIDELLTPDSSRYCREDELARAVLEKRSPVTMDKQIIRDYLDQMGWDRNPPAPSLPPEIIRDTLAQYKQIQEIIEWIFTQK